MHRFSLLEVRYPDKPARFFANGKRISRDEWERIHIRANIDGRLDCFSTRAIPQPGGTFKRFNYSHAVYH